MFFSLLAYQPFDFIIWYKAMKNSQSCIVALKEKIKAFTVLQWCIEPHPEVKTLTFAFRDVIPLLYTVCTMQSNFRQQ